MPAHQPGNPLDIARRQAQPAAEDARILLAQHRVVAAATLGDVVEQPRQQQHLGYRQARPDFTTQRKLALRRRVGEARQIAQHAQGVFVDRVDVEQVVLHAPEHLAERRQDRRQQAVPVHPPQRLHRRRTTTQQLQEDGQHLAVVGQRIAMRGGGLVDAAHGVGAEAEHTGLVHPGDEDLHQRRRPAHEQLRVARRQALAVANEVGTHGHRFVRQLQHLLEAFGHLHAEPLDLAGGAVIALHELLDAEVLLVLVLEAQPRGQCPLVIEQQPFLGSARLQVQRVAVAAQDGFGLLQRGLLGGVEQALDHHVGQIVRMRQAPPHPAQRIERAQAAGPVLEVRLEVVGGIVEAGMPRVALGQPGGQVFLRRPQRRVLDDGPQPRVEHRVAGQPVRVQQAGEHAGILRGQRAALRGIAHRMADLQADVPQRGEELLQRAQACRFRCLHQGQQIHVRVRKQQAAAETTDREQRRSGHVAEAGHPYVRHDARHRLAPAPRQRAGVGAIAKRGGQRAVDVAQQLPQGPPRFGRNAGTRHRHGKARQRREGNGGRGD